MNQIWINKCGHIHAYNERVFGSEIKINNDDECCRCHDPKYGIASGTKTADTVRRWLGVE